MNRAQARTAIKTAMAELKEWEIDYVTDALAAVTGLPIGVVDARGVFWNVVLVADPTGY